MAVLARLLSIMRNFLSKTKGMRDLLYLGIVELLEKYICP